MMLAENFRSGVVQHSLRLWTFLQEPAFLEFKHVGGGIRVGCAMKDIGPRREVGLLQFDESPREPPREAVIRVLARRFRIRTWETYSSPESFGVSAARFELDIGELWVAANAFPMHVCVRLGNHQHGTPEYDWKDYRKSHV